MTAEEKLVQIDALFASQVQGLGGAISDLQNQINAIQSSLDPLKAKMATVNEFYAAVRNIINS